MTNAATKTYLVTVIERCLVFYEVEAEDARTAAENWQYGLFDGRDDEALEAEGACSVREQQADGSYRKLPESEWREEPPASNDTANLRHVIREANHEETVYWSNNTGWGCLAAADIFNASERNALRLPLGGQWVALKPYSVLLHYPDYLDDTGYETFYTFVDATDAIEAVAVAQREAVAVQAIEIDDAADFRPLLVTEGHQRSEPLFDK